MDLRQWLVKREEQAESDREEQDETNIDSEHSDKDAADTSDARASCHGFVGQMTSVHTNGFVSHMQTVKLSSLYWKAFKEVGSHPVALPGHAALTSAEHVLPPLPMVLNFQQRFSQLVSMQRHCIVSTQLDGHGELILSATASGKISLHDLRMLQDCSANSIQDEESGYRGLDPLLLLDTQRRLERACWHPTNDNLFAAVAASDRSVYLYDAQYTQGAPYQALSVPQSMWPGVGLTDVLLAAKGPYSAMAAAQDGHVYLWDQRGGSAPRVKLGKGDKHSVNSLQLSDDSHLLLTSTAAGDILAYDLRGGTGTVMSFGNQNRHPVVLEVGIRQALLQLPELSQQTSIGRCNVQSINIDPRDSNRLAFHLASGWSGVLDLMSQEVTHVHCPPALPENSIDGWDSTQPSRRVSDRQRPCWSASGTSYCVGDVSGTGLSVIDFHPSIHSPCHLGAADMVHIEAGAKLSHSHWHESSIPSAVSVAVSAAVTAVSAHSDTDEIVAGTEAGTLLLLSA